MIRALVVLAVVATMFVALANMVAYVAAWSPWVSVVVLAAGVWTLIYWASRQLQAS